MNVLLQLEAQGNQGPTEAVWRWLVDWPAIPREGDYVELFGDSSWTERVHYVVWKVDWDAHANIDEETGEELEPHKFQVTVLVRWTVLLEIWEDTSDERGAEQREIVQRLDRMTNSNEMDRLTERAPVYAQEEARRQAWGGRR